MALVFKKSTAQPEFTVAAAIAGTLEATQTLTCSYTVVRARTTNVTCRWYRHTADDGSDPTGALLGIGTTYTLTGTDVGNYIRAIVTAINPAGIVQSTTAYTAVITSAEPPTPPTIVTAAVITGTADVNETLTVTADFNGETSITYQWYSYTTEPTGSPLAGTDEVELGTASTQLLTASEAGRWIVVVVTATNAAGPAVTSASVAMAGVDPWEPMPPEEYSPPAYDTTGMEFVYAFSGDDLQAKFNALAPGQCLVLEAGATWTGAQGGRFIFPAANANGSDWIYVVSSRIADLPGGGLRVSLSDSAYMPAIKSHNSASSYCLSVERGASKVRFVGIDLQSGYTSTSGSQPGLVRIGWGGSGDATDIIFDRCLIRGTTTGNCYSGIVWYYSDRSALINSHVTEFHTINGESQGVWPRNDCTRVLVENNYIAAASISFFTGDNDVTVPVEDLVVRGNLITKEASWNPNDPSYSGYDWLIKNVFELKGCSRVLVEGNVFENQWLDGQFNGGAFQLTPRGAAVNDVKIVNNIIRNCAHGANINNADKSILRMRISNNVFYKPALTLQGGAAYYHMWITSGYYGAINYLRIDHNTFTQSAGRNDVLGVIRHELSPGNKYILNLKVDHNIWDNGYNSIIGSSTAVGRPSAEAFCTDYIYQNNGMWRYPYWNPWPPANEANWGGWIYAGSGISSVGFADPACNEPADIVLLNTSPFYQQGDSGEDLGANISAILAATNDE